MKIAAATTVLALLAAVPAHADITVKQTISGKGLGMGTNVPATTYIKGHKMRSDTVVGETTQSIVFDVDSQKMYVFDSKKKEADVWDMAAFANEVGRSVDMSSTKASFKPNGQTKQLGGKTANGYDLDVSMAATFGGGKDMNTTITMSGPVWIVPNAPGAADYAGFYEAAIEKGWIFTDPRAAKAQPGQAKAVAEMYKQIAATKGVPYLIDMQMKMGGAGPMGAILARMGNIQMTTTVESVDVGPLSDDLFAPPAGYKLNPKK